ncbi:hypothetical protein IscW_ISCW020325 [Ixodes scapularis]|uniref:Uncharacterized protein n=1 Tax=Ixodes scapularis TaxID=6945 RepID=B7PZW3_IXOSC|nr:hypothetical protein IscW_ISCW020325 [Ixodes scapularis]|eukprot:XP_002406277.1 hypothetical protein IscW_ISCW020325 [Ixodes scapularis]
MAAPSVVCDERRADREDVGRRISRACVFEGIVVLAAGTGGSKARIGVEGSHFRDAPLLESRFGTPGEMEKNGANAKGFLTEATCPVKVTVRTDPIADHYNVEPRPFAR